MEKLRLGTIGTSWITEQFIEAALASEKYSLEAVYSRTLEKATDFTDKFSGEKAYDDWEAFLTDSAIDVVYIASPNSLHYEQAMEVLNHDKHAVVEKPMVTSSAEWESLIQLAKKQGKVVVEAARHIFEPNFIKATEMLSDLGQVYGASLTFSSYSSRYDNVLKGEEPAIFSTKFDGGATNDLGIYVVYAAIRWFGKPDSVHAFMQKVRTGVDGKGTAIFRYADFDVTLHFSKMSTSLHSTEIYGADQTLILNGITDVSSIELVDVRTKEKSEVALDAPAENPLSWEAAAFADVMQNMDQQENKEKLEDWWNLSKDVHEVLEMMREQAN